MPHSKCLITPDTCPCKRNLLRKPPSNTHTHTSPSDTPAPPPSQLLMRDAVLLFLASPVCRLITRPRWFLQHWEEVKQSATHARGPSAATTGSRPITKRWEVKGLRKQTATTPFTLPFYSTAPCHGPSQSPLPRAKWRTVKTNLRATKAPNLSVLILPHTSKNTFALKKETKMSISTRDCDK